MGLLLAKEPQNESILFLIGDAHLNNGEINKAISIYRRVIELDSNSLDAYKKLLNAFDVNSEKNKNFRYEQRVILTDMIKKFGAQLDFYARFCRLYSEDGFVAETIKNCKKAIELDSSNPDNYIYLGRAFVDQKKGEKGRKLIYETASEYPQSALAQKMAGKMAFAQNNFPYALKYYSGCVKIEVKNSVCLEGVAQSAYEMQDYKKALEAYKAACYLDRRHIQIFRVAAAKLRSSARQKWYLKFQNGLDNCR